MSDERKYKWIGTRPIRPDGLDKVTGRANFGADMTFPGMLHGKVLRSPHAHARSRSINVEPALAPPPGRGRQGAKTRLWVTTATCCARFRTSS